MADLHTSLSDKGIIKTVQVDKKKLFEVTDNGRAAAVNAGIYIKRKDTRGGIEHHYWIAQTVQFLRKHEFQPVLEKDNIDIVDSSRGLAIEIETGKSDINGNLLKPENSRNAACFMLATSREVELKIKQIVAQAQPKKPIKIMFVKDFIKLTKEQITHSG